MPPLQILIGVGRVPVPPPPEQLAAVRSLLSKTKFDSGESANLISEQWYRRWRESVGFDRTPTHSRVPPIDNSSLISSNGSLRKSLVPSFDYSVIASSAWALFKQWYGGGPDISVTFEFDPIQKKTVPALHRSCFSVRFCGETKKIQISKFRTIGELKKIACDAFEIGEGDCALFEFWNREKEKRIVRLSEGKIIAELCLKDGETLLLDREKPVRRSSEPSQPPRIIAPLAPREASASSESVSRATVSGFVNYGNTCFMNSALQCLLHCDAFVRFFISGKHKADANRENKFGTRCRVLTAFASIIERYFSGDSSPLKPGPILTSLSDYAPSFRSLRQQQDAHEFLLFLLDYVHEDLNRAIDKVTGQQLRVVSEPIPTDETAEAAWERHRARNDSIVVDLFHGLLRSKIVCPDCGQSSFIFEPFVTLPLSLPVSQISISFLFVPADIRTPKLRITATLRLGSSAAAFVRLIASEIGREVQIAFAVHHRRGDTFYWSLTPPEDHRGGDLLVFEIPNAARCYTVSSIAVRRRGFWGDHDDTVDDYVLVELPRAGGEFEEIAAACEEKFAYLWDLNDDQEEHVVFQDMTPQIVALMDSMAVGEGKMSVEKRSEMFGGLAFIARFAVRVTLSQTFMKSNVGFKWHRLLRKTVARAPEGAAPTLENYLKQFRARTVLDEGNAWHCPACKRAVLAEKSVEVWRLPKYLIIHLKRFRHVAGNVFKIGGEVRFSELLDLTGVVAEEGVLKYSLCAVCEHFGSAQFGHYAAHVRSGGKWVFANDEACEAAEKPTGHTQAAYILFYEQIE